MRDRQAKNRKNMQNSKTARPQIKKDIKTFLTSTDGKVNKKDIARIAMGILALGAGAANLGKADPTSAACAHGSWSSSCYSCGGY